MPLKKKKKMNKFLFFYETVLKDRSIVFFLQLSKLFVLIHFPKYPNDCLFSNWNWKESVPSTVNITLRFGSGDICASGDNTIVSIVIASVYYIVKYPKIKRNLENLIMKCRQLHAIIV